MTVVTIKVSGKMYDGSTRSKVVLDGSRRTFPMDWREIDPELFREHSFETLLKKFFTRIAVPFAVGMSMLSTAGKVLADAASNNAPQAVEAMSSLSGLGSGIMPLIHMVQDFALPVGIVVSSWGLIEMMMGNIEAGKHKMKWAIIGFIGMFLIPDVFYTIHDAFAHHSVGG